MTGPDLGAGSQRVTETPPAASDVGATGVGELISRVTTDLTTLLNQELALAKAEIRIEATKAGKTVGAFGGAAGAGYFTLLFASWTLLFALHALFSSYTWAALVVTLLYGIAAAVLFVKGRATAQSINPKPEVTVQTLKEDAQWARTRKS